MSFLTPRRKGCKALIAPLEERSARGAAFSLEERHAKSVTLGKVTKNTKKLIEILALKHGKLDPRSRLYGILLNDSRKFRLGQKNRKA